MKKIYIILFIIPLIGLGQNVKFNKELSSYDGIYYLEESPFNGIRITEYDDGGWSLMTIKNGLPNGLYQDFHSNGKLNFMGDYINGLNRDGIWRRWYTNGQLQSIMFYDGTRGDIETVTSNGLISIQCFDKGGNETQCD